MKSKTLIHVYIDQEIKNALDDIVIDRKKSLVGVKYTRSDLAREAIYRFVADYPSNIKSKKMKAYSRGIKK